MATIHKRTMVNLPPNIKLALSELAKKKNKSVSKVTADLLEFALNIHEDIYLDEIATERTSQDFEVLSHNDIWE